MTNHIGKWGEDKYPSLNGKTVTGVRLNQHGEIMEVKVEGDSVLPFAQIISAVVRGKSTGFLLVGVDELGSVFSRDANVQLMKGIDNIPLY